MVSSLLTLLAARFIVGGTEEGAEIVLVSSVLAIEVAETVTGGDTTEGTKIVVVSSFLDVTGG